MSAVTAGTAAETAAKTQWRIVAEEVISCNCAWGCPCQFNALPTGDNCEAFGAIDILEGHFGTTRLDGARFAIVYKWPGAVHEGKGSRRLILDERTTPAQREAIQALFSGQHGHPFFEIFSAVAPNEQEPLVAPISLEYDREQRTAQLRIPNIGEARIEPIKNPVTGEEHRARIDLPNGFEYKQAEMGNGVSWRVAAGEPLVMQHENTYAQMARVEWSSDGSTE